MASSGEQKMPLTVFGGAFAISDLVNVGFMFDHWGGEGV